MSIFRKEQTSPEQPELRTHSGNILDVDGYQFKDLNKNGTLEPYEDWRLSPQERSTDLLGRMTLEEKAGMMLIADMRMHNEQSIMDTMGTTDQKAPVTAAFNEDDVVIDKNQFTGEPSHTL